MSWEDREVEELKLDERFREKVYKDSLGYWTIGYGQHDGVTESTPDTTEEQAAEWLQAKVQKVVDACSEMIDCFQGLDGARKGALTNMAYQLGPTKLSSFHQFINLLDMARYEDAADDLETTLWYKQTPNRAKRIAYRIRTGEYADRT